MITPRRLEALQWIRDFMRKNGWSPTVREVGTALGWASTSTTQYHLDRLRDDGLLERGAGPRQLRLTEQGREKTV